MKRILFLIIFPALCLMTACESQTPPADTPPVVADDKAAEKKETATTKVPDEAPTAPAPVEDVVVAEDTKGTGGTLEADIQFIQDKFAIINQGTNYKTVPFNMECEGMAYFQLNRKYNEKGELSYLISGDCSEHGCETKEYYYWEGELIFAYKKKDFTPGSSHFIEEYRTYFKNGKAIRCLEKEAHNNMGEPPMKDLLSKARNKEVECSTEFLEDATEELKTLKVEDARKYFCPDGAEILGSYSSYDCAKQNEVEAFTCECSFSPGGGNKELPLFAWDMGKEACVKVNGELNSLYPDWEERDYKKDLKDLASQSGWISASGNSVTYFGKPLEDYKYADPVDFLIDVILASGKEIDVIPIQTTTGGATFDQAKANAEEAVNKAKAYKAKGGADPLNILKMDNRSYDVIVRYRQLTQYEGEANKYEGTITLLPARGKEILETRTIKGTCGC